VVAAARFGLCPPFSAPPAAQSGWGRSPNPRAGCKISNRNRWLAVDGALDGQLRYGIRAGLAFEIHFVPG
jgi:hypothetical protein